MTRRPLTAIAALTLSLAACTSSAGGGGVVPTDVPIPPTSTTVASSIATTSTTVDAKTAVRAVHIRFMKELFNRDERVTGPESVLPLAEELTTGTELARIQESVASNVQTGQRLVGPGYDSHIVSIDLNDESHAIVTDCSLGRAAGYDANGKLIAPPATKYILRQTELVLVGGRWLVNDFITGGDVACDPAKFPAS